MELVRVDAKISEYSDASNGDYIAGDLVSRGDFILVDPDKLIGVSVKRELVFGVNRIRPMPYQWFVCLLLVEYSSKYCIGECVNREHAIQVVNELPDGLGCAKQE